MAFVPSRLPLLSGADSRQSGRPPRWQRLGTNQRCQRAAHPRTFVQRIVGVCRWWLWPATCSGIDQAGRDSLGYSFSNNGRPGMLLEAPRGLFRSEKEKQEFMDRINAKHEGVEASGRTMLLSEGIKATVMPQSASDAQFLESRGFSREDIAMLFGTQNMIGEGKAVYKDLTQRFTAYVQNCLNKWFERWEQECRRKLLSEREKRAGGYKYEIDPSQFLKGDPTTLAGYTASMRSQGIMSGNEARQLHGLNPVDGLDTYENPNISVSVGASAEQVDQASSESDGDSDDNSGAVAMRRNFATLIEHEQRRLNAAAGSKGNFIAWAERFYQKFRDRLYDVCEAVGIPDTRCRRLL